MPVETKEIKKNMSSNTILKYLGDFNTFLEGVPKMITYYFNGIFKSETGLTQKSVDMICEWISWKVNVMVETGRQQVVKALYEQNKWVTNITAPIRVVYKIYQDPIGALGEVINAVKQILNIFLGPFSFLIEFVPALVRELERLVKNLAAIANMSPPTQNAKNINFDKFQLKIGTMGMNTILNDPENLPPPEEMFGEEPPTPFSTKYFKELGNEGKKIWRDERTFLNLDKNNSNSENN